MKTWKEFVQRVTDTAESYPRFNTKMAIDIDRELGHWSLGCGLEELIYVG